jgi:uncharacterized protein YdeI (YjbR/CyaY-like superfamily)
MPTSDPPDPVILPTGADFRRWLEANHDTASELWIGYYKKGSGRTSMTYAEAVDEALCFGWIDGQVRSISDEVYAHRYTPRKAGSIWSAKNVRRVGELTAEGRMHPAGIRAFESRSEAKTGIYAYENRPRELPVPYAEALRRNEQASAYFEAQPPSYRRTVTWWILSAKREETRQRRLERLIEDSAAGRWISQFIPPGSRTRERPG